MTSQKYSGIFQSDFDPKHKTVRKTKEDVVKKLKKDRKDKNKFQDQRQYIATVSQ